MHNNKIKRMKSQESNAPAAASECQFRRPTTHALHAPDRPANSSRADTSKRNDILIFLRLRFCSCSCVAFLMVEARRRGAKKTKTEEQKANVNSQRQKHSEHQ